MDANTSKNEWSEREVGALWKRSGPNQKYLTGKVKVEGVEKNVVIFSNKNKTKDNQPDFRVYLSRDRQADASDTSEAVESSNESQEDLL
jgi:uncharacterized protein (DUF736 family)